MATDLIGGLPLPLAQIYLRARNARSPAERHHNAYYLLEASARVSAALLIWAYAGEDSPNPKVDKTLQALSQPSIGQWVGVLRELAVHFGGGEEASGHALRAWCRLFTERTRDLPRCAALARVIAEEDELDLGFGEKLSPVDVFNLLPAYRNKHLGHGAMAGEVFFQRMATLIREASEELLAKVDPLAEGELLFVEERRETGGGEAAVERIRLTGATPLRLDTLDGPAEAMEPWVPGRLLAAWPDREPIALHPLLHGSYAEERAEVSFFNKRAGTHSAEYLNYATGLLTKVSFAEEEFRFIDEASLDADKRSRRRVPQTAAGATPAPEPSRPGKVWRRSVAVLGFKNLVGRPESAWLSVALAEMLTTELAAGGRLRLIPGENVARMKIDLALSDTESFSRETLSRIRANVGCDFVVLGSYLAMGEKAGGQIRLDLRVQDAAVGSTLASCMETGGESDFLGLVSRAGARLRETFGEEALTAAQARQVRAAQPSGLDAMKPYAEGLAKLRTYDALAARELFETAVAADPKHALAQSALAAAWSVLGYDERAKEEAKVAFGLSGELSREDGLLVEGRFREYAREWEKTIEIYRSLYTFFPDNMDYGIKLVEALAWAGKGKETGPILSALRELPPPASEDPRIDLAEARVAQALSDARACRDATARAAEKAAALGAGTFVARARFLEAFALGLLGENDKALAAAEESKTLFSKAGDMGGVADALNSAALVHWRNGNLAESQKLHEEAFETFEAIGKRHGMAAALQNLSWVLYRRGNLDQSMEKARDSLRIWREIVNQRGEAEVLGNLGLLFFERLDLSKARACLEESIQIQNETNNLNGSAYTLNDLGLVLLEEGNYQDAIAKFSKALSIMESAGNRPGMGISLGNLGLALFFQGNLPSAEATLKDTVEALRTIGDKSLLVYALDYLGNIYLCEGQKNLAKKHFEEALAISQDLDEEDAKCQIKLDLGNFFLEAGLFADAQQKALEAGEGLRKSGLREEEAIAACTLVKALLAQGMIEEARLHLDRVRELLLELDHPHFRLVVTMAAARMEAASGEPVRAGAAFDVLEARLQEASGSTPLHVLYEARLTLGEIALRAGRTGEARSILHALQEEAAAKGYMLVAGKVSSLAGRNTI